MMKKKINVQMMTVLMGVTWNEEEKKEEEEDTGYRH